MSEFSVVCSFGLHKNDPRNHIKSHEQSRFFFYFFLLTFSFTRFQSFFHSLQKLPNRLINSSLQS